MEDIKFDRISKRFFILDKLEYFISESVYYRSFSEDIKNNKKLVLFNIKDTEGKVEIS